MSNKNSEIIQADEIGLIKEYMQNMSEDSQRPYLRGYFHMMIFGVAVSRGYSKDEPSSQELGYYLLQNSLLTDYLVKTMKNLDMQLELRCVSGALEKARKSVDDIATDLLKIFKD